MVDESLLTDALSKVNSLEKDLETQKELVVDMKELLLMKAERRVSKL